MEDRRATQAAFEKAPRKSPALLGSLRVETEAARLGDCPRSACATPRRTIRDLRCNRATGRRPTFRL